MVLSIPSLQFLEKGPLSPMMFQNKMDPPTKMLHNVSSPAGNFVGKSYSGNVRRFSRVMKVLTEKTTPPFTNAGASVSFTTHSLIESFTMFHSQAELEELSVSFLPKAALNGHVLTLSLAWHPHTETGVTKESIQDFPTHERHVLYCPEDACPQALTSKCTFDWGVQQSFKPLPIFGGYPVLQVFWDLEAIGQIADPPTYSNGVRYVEILVTGIVRVH
uniref:Uncharacterized protein n=1 Tax=Wallace's spikemoss associated tymo-like virus 1 TaxID=2933193 RepID=A0A9C7GWR2_9VIRU|nr:hypothetical protein [Wallace's spikemoss associated tymo-like virus 1]CAI5384005.1 hypothetical protein [Wallace's spikemoss associated tymo-like virus 1]